jgi:hypothetical protein
MPTHQQGSGGPIRRMFSKPVNKKGASNNKKHPNMLSTLKRADSMRTLGLSTTELMQADDNNCMIRWFKRTMRGAVVLNVFTWLVFLFLFSFYISNLLCDAR